MSNVLFTADEHFGHNNVINYCHRPFKNTEEMREKLIANHNEVVKPGDRVYHLGDMFWRTLEVGEALTIRHRLNGEHYYIYGNHDELFRKKEVCDSFIWCRDMENLRAQGYPNIVLCHFAMRTWNGHHKGSWQLYGHSHAGLPEITNKNKREGESPYSFDVGVDACNLYPISLEEVKLRMEQKGWKQ